jgi:hypothetical protein
LFTKRRNWDPQGDSWIPFQPVSFPNSGTLPNSGMFPMPHCHMTGCNSRHIFTPFFHILRPGAGTDRVSTHRYPNLHRLVFDFW